VPAIEVTAGRAEAPQFRFPTVEIFEGEAESVAPAAPEEKPAPLESALTAADRLAAELPAELPAAEPAEAKLEAGARSGLRLPGSEEVARIAAEMAALRSADRREPARAEVAAPPAASPAMPVAAPLSAEVEDDLLAILGIGPVYARRLREAGITTFAALAEANDEVLEKITAGNLERVIRDDWRGQARRLAGRL
jgi:predicted flap endonuclease-1-like 5' DNA nuclease